MTRQLGALVIAVGVAVVLAGPAETYAQTATSFEQMKVLVDPREPVTITATTGQRTRGRLVELSDSTLRLSIDGVATDFASAEVVEVRQRHNDSLANGAKNGAWVGVGLATLLALGALTDGGNAGAEQFAWIVAGGAFYIGLGAGIGVGIDALIKEDRLVYERRSPRSSVKLSVVPVLSGRQQGVMVSMKF